MKPERHDLIPGLLLACALHFFRTRMAASSTTEFPIIRMAAATTASRVVHAVGCSGQTTLITAGMSSGWTKTTSMVSPDALIARWQGRGG